MVGERTGARFRLGDRLTVKVVRVDLETSKIDFTLVSHSSHLKINAPQANIHEASGDANKRTLSAKKDKVSSDYKPMSTRALEKAKHDRSGSKKKAVKTHASPPQKQRTKNTKNKGKPKR
jgi:ribonuclease R